MKWYWEYKYRQFYTNENEINSDDDEDYWYNIQLSEDDKQNYDNEDAKYFWVNIINFDIIKLFLSFISQQHNQLSNFDLICCN